MTDSWRGDQLQVGVSAASADYGAAELKVSPPWALLLLPLFQLDAVLSDGACGRGLSIHSPVRRAEIGRWLG